MAWAFASMSLVDDKLFAALGREVEQRLSELHVQNFANSAWTFATVNRPEDADGLEAEQRVSQLNMRDIANTAWAFARAGQ